MGITIAKDAIDIGIAVRDIDAVLAFGIDLDHMERGRAWALGHLAGSAWRTARAGGRAPMSLHQGRHDSPTDAVPIAASNAMEQAEDNLALALANFAEL